MGDPLSVAASTAGLVSLGLQSTEYLYKYYAAVRDRHHELARIADLLSGLLEPLHIIDDIVRTRTWRPNEHALIGRIEDSIRRSDQAIHGLQQEVDKFKNEPAGTWKQKAVVVGRRAAYPFKRSTLEDLADDINDFRDNLAVALQALQLKEHENTQSDIHAVNTIVRSIQTHNVSVDLRQWLKGPDASVDFNNAIAKRHAGTGQWLVQDTVYNTWLHHDNSFLWLHGFAGCGKSVLCSTAIEHAYRRRLSAGSVIAFFFFTFNDKSKQDASAVLRALLLQLCGQVSGLEVDLSCLQDVYSHGTPPVIVLLEHLRLAVARCHHVYILLDALDESPIHSSRAEVLSAIETMRQWQLPSLHLLVTSRDVIDIRDRLQVPNLNKGVEHILLKNASIQQDISDYVAFQVDHDRQLQRWGYHREKIKSYLTRHAGGVFRWVECQLQPLRQCPGSERHLEKCLRTLPQSLDETYEQILYNIESRKEAQQLLSLLCYASRPLTVGEVIEALAVDIDDLDCYDPRSRLAGGADDLLRICPGLIEISLGSHIDNDANFLNRGAKDENPHENIVGVQVVQIAHFSVQEYLLSERIRKSRVADFGLSGPLQHARISKACVLYLSHSDFLQQNLCPNLVEQYAFARYAAQHWHYHFREADIKFAQHSLPMIAVLLSGGRLTERWIQLYDPHCPWNTKVSYDNSARNIPSATYYASLLGLDLVLAYILSASVADVNVQGGEYSNALQAATQCGHEKVVQLLLDKGANVNVYGAYRITALQVACERGYEKVVQLLLEKGANVNAQGGEYGNALHLASECGHQKVVQLLLDNGADLNAQGPRYSTALQAASASGKNQLLQLLLAKGANINAQGGYYGTVLQAAVAWGNEKTVELLLDKGAEINAHGGFYGFALQVASAGMIPQVSGLPSVIGGNIGAQLSTYGDPWLEISAFQREKMVQLLLDRGADVNAQGGYYGNALQAASQAGHERVVQLLLDKDPDVNAQGGWYGNALYAASEGGHETVVQMLLDKGATNLS